MALNASGAISLAGSTTGESIASELGLGSTTAISLNDAAVRSLAGVASGAIIMPTNFHGKAYVVAGLYRRTYSGYHNELTNSFFASASQTAAAVDLNLGNYGSVPTSTSLQWLGYFVPATTETYTFYTNSDDGSYIWVGATAVSGFTRAAALVDNGDGHGTQERQGSIALTSGVKYAFRMQTGNGGGPGDHRTSWSSPSLGRTDNFAGRVFHSPTTLGL